MSSCDRQRAALLRILLYSALAATACSEGADAAFDEPDAAKVAPADHVLLRSDRSGAFFVPEKLKQQYDELIARLADLRSRIDSARIDGKTARKELAELDASLKSLRQQLDRAKLYVPGAEIHRKSVVEEFPLAADELLFIECANLEIRGWEGPGVRATLEKTVLTEPGDEPSADFDGITLVHDTTTGQEKFGFYLTMRERPDGKTEWERFLFKDFADSEFLRITVSGLIYQEGNRQIDIESKNARGNGIVGSSWRRHARLILEIPNCRRVGIEGGLGGLVVKDLDAPLVVRGDGNRENDARYEVTSLGGSLVARNLPFVTVRGIRGDASIFATAFAGTSGPSHRGASITVRPAAPEPAMYGDVSGSLTVRTTRADLTIGKIGGTLDVENDFGRTVLPSAAPLAPGSHRIVSQSGAIELSLSEQAVKSSGLKMFTECGTLRLPTEMDRILDSLMFYTSGDKIGGIGDGVGRSLHGYRVREEDDRRSFEVLSDIAISLDRIPVAPGLYVMNRAGSIILTTP